MDTNTMAKMIPARIVRSTSYAGQVSIRDGAGQDVRFALREAGYRDGDQVAVLPLEDYERLCQLQAKEG